MKVAINCHVLWIMCGCPLDGLLFDMRKDTRSSYHKQIKYIRQNKNAICKKTEYEMCGLVMTVVNFDDL